MLVLARPGLLMSMRGFEIWPLRLVFNRLKDPWSLVYGARS